VHQFYRRADVAFVIWRDDLGFWISQERSDGATINNASLREFLVAGDAQAVKALEDYLETAMTTYELERNAHRS
jgi:hypothetical protein